MCELNSSIESLIDVGNESMENIHNFENQFDVVTVEQVPSETENHEIPGETDGKT